MTIEDFLPLIKTLHERIRATVLEACERSSVESLSEVAADEPGDTIYAVDRISEEELVEFFEKEVASFEPIVLIGEGLEGGKVVLPRGSSESDARWRVIVDPIDGTRGLMFQKRPAWILTGVAPNRGAPTILADIEFAMQTEIPLVKQHQSDMLWAFRGRGAEAERFDRTTGETSRLRLRPSTNATIEHGFATVSRFMPGFGSGPADVYDAVVHAALGDGPAGKAQCFEDQYISTGGQLYELMAGHDRFVCDLRPLFEEAIAASGRKLGLCCHPYDLCTELIARELGVIVTDENGERLEAMLAVEPDVAWCGYANESIRRQIEPHLTDAVSRLKGN